MRQNRRPQNACHLIVIILNCILVFHRSSATPPPLTAHDSGLYAISPWANLGPGQTEPGGTFERTSSVGLNFSVRSIWNNESNPDPDLSHIIDEINAGQLYQDPYTMLVRISFWDGPERHSGPMLAPTVYRTRILQSIQRLEPVLDKIHGISLAEENVPIGGRTQLLQYLYVRIEKPAIGFQPLPFIGFGVCEVGCPPLVNR